MNNEKLALKIKTTLDGLCPAFITNPTGPDIWRGCDCLVADGPCECVWMLTSECDGGKWKQLDFVDEATSKDQAIRMSMLDKVIKARSV